MKEYRSNAGMLSAEDLNVWYTQMSTKRQEKCDRYVDEKAKKLCIAADHLIRSALSEELKISTEQISLLISPDGKPYLEGNPLYFSYSHSYPYVVAAISETPIGIDIEKIRPVRGKAEKICTKRELEYLQEADSEDVYNQRFIEIWTKKEAIFKIDGRLPRKDKETETLNPEKDIYLTTKKIEDYIVTIAQKI